MAVGPTTTQTQQYTPPIGGSWVVGPGGQPYLTGVAPGGVPDLGGGPMSTYIPGLGAAWQPTSPGFYWEGAQYGPATQPPDQMSNLQARLVAGGWLRDGSFINGVWDDASAGAYEDLLAAANRMGVPWDQLLGQSITSGRRGGGSGGAAAPKLPNPDEVKALLNDSAHTLIGKNLDEAALNAGVTAFYNSYQNPGAGYQPASPQTIAESYLKSTAPGEVQAHAAVDAYDVLAKMLSGIQ